MPTAIIVNIVVVIVVSIHDCKCVFLSCSLVLVLSIYICQFFIRVVCCILNSIFRVHSQIDCMLFVLHILARAPNSLKSKNKMQREAQHTKKNRATATANKTAHNFRHTRKNTAKKCCGEFRISSSRKKNTTTQFYGVELNRKSAISSNVTNHFIEKKKQSEVKKRQHPNWTKRFKGPAPMMFVNVYARF